MRIIRESIDRFFDYDFHLETRTIFISDMEDGTGVGPLMAEKVIKSIHILQSADAEKQINIIMNSQGGEWYSGMAIYDCISACPCPVKIEVYGSCMSMATVILQAADERILHPNVIFMIHDGKDYFEGDAKNFEAWGQNSQHLRQRMYEIYAKASEREPKFWAKKCGTDFIITAKEAVELGLADKVAGQEEEDK